MMRIVELAGMRIIPVVDRKSSTMTARLNTSNSIRPGIVGTGHYLPSEAIPNSFFKGTLGLSHDWIVQRTGIGERRKAAPEESSATMGSRAGREAITAAGITPCDIDLIICATISPKTPLPSTACLIQDDLGAHRAVCFDVAAACAGFLYGLEIATTMIGSGRYSNALVIGVDTMTRLIDYGDPQTCILFGDGAGAAIVSAAASGARLLGTKLYADGAQAQLAYIPDFFTGAANQKLKMDGKRTFKQAVQSMTSACVELLKENHLRASQIDLVIPHQANQRIIDALTIALELDVDRVFSNINVVGNTAAASIPISLDICMRGERIKPGNKVLITAFGGGTVWGASLIAS